MTLGANFYVKLGLGGAGYKCVTTVAGYSCLVVSGMDSFFHFFHLSIKNVVYKFLFSSSLLMEPQTAVLLYHKRRYGARLILTFLRYFR